MKKPGKRGKEKAGKKKKVEWREQENCLRGWDLGPLRISLELNKRYHWNKLQESKTFCSDYILICTQLSSKKNDLQVQEDFQISEIKSIRAVVSLPSCFFLLLFLECQRDKKKKNAFQAQLKTQIKWGKERKGENTNMLLRGSGYHSLPLDICKCWWMAEPSRNSALIPAPRRTHENIQSPLSQESSPPYRVTEHEVDIWRQWTG